MQMLFARSMLHDVNATLFAVNGSSDSRGWAPPPPEP